MALKKMFKSLLLYYLYGQYMYLDPVEKSNLNLLSVNSQIEPQNGDSNRVDYTPSKWNFTFMPHLFVYVLSIAFGVFGLQYYSTGEINLQTLSKCPYIMSHQIFLPDTWAQVDLCYYGAALATFCAYASFVLHPTQKERYKMFLKNSGRLVIQGRELNKEDSERICSFRARFKTPIFGSIVIIDLLAMIYFYIFLLYQNLYRVTIVDGLFWLVLFPRFMFDIAFGLFGIMVFVIITCKYAQIRLTTILVSMKKLNSRMEKSQNGKQRFIGLAWMRYTQLNRQLLSLCSDIEVFTHFWSPYLSIMFPFYVWVQAYLAYVFIFVDTIPYVQKYLFFVGIIEIDLMLFLLIEQCARMVKLSQRILSENRRFFINIQRIDPGQRIKVFDLLLAEALQISKRLHVYAFRLFGNYRITSKTFHLVISYMSIFFLLVIKSQKMNNGSILFV